MSDARWAALLMAVAALVAAFMVLHVCLNYGLDELPGLYSITYAFRRA